MANITNQTVHERLEGVLAELEEVKKELQAVVTREEYYSEMRGMVQMVPWSELKEVERKNALLYWGPK